MAFSFRPGIRTEIVFTLTVLMAGAVALVGVLFLKVEERNLLEQKIREGKQGVAALQNFLQDWKPEDRGPDRGDLAGGPAGSDCKAMVSMEYVANPSR